MCKSHSQLTNATVGGTLERLCHVSRTLFSVSVRSGESQVTDQSLALLDTDEGTWLAPSSALVMSKMPDSLVPDPAWPSIGGPL